MCGIAGFYAWGQRRPPLRTLKSLFLAQQTRGQSAAGMAFLTPGSDDQITVLKRKGPAQELILETPKETWEAVAQSPRALFHARATTKGTENNNENNHPVVGYDWYVVHNGMVFNDDDLWTLYKKAGPRFAEVDTSAINLVLGQGEDLLDSMSYLTQLGGSVTAGMWSRKYPDHIALVRLGSNDLFMFLDEDILYWSSAPVAGRVIPGIDIGQTRFLTMSRMGDDRLLVLTPGERGGQTFKVERVPFAIPTVRVPTSTTALGGWTGRNKGSGGGPDDILSIDVAHNNNAVYPAMPIPAPVSLKQFSWDKAKLVEICRVLIQDKTQDSITTETMYGRWIVRLVKKPAEGAPKTYRVFKPHRRMKKFWHKAFPSIVLPVALNEKGESSYDKLMTLNTLRVKVRWHNSIWTEDGYVCPWCGVWAKNANWSQENGRCTFCKIASKSPLTR